MDIQNKKISIDEFNRQRQEVLTQWHTGKDVDLQEAVDYHKSMPQERKNAISHRANALEITRKELENRGL